MPVRLFFWLELCEKKELLVMAAKINKASSSGAASVAVLAVKKRCSKAASENIFGDEVVNDRELSYEYEDEVEEGGEDQRGAVDDSVKQYLKEIGMYPLLTAEQELLLAERIARGDGRARQRLIE